MMRDIPSLKARLGPAAMALAAALSILAIPAWAHEYGAGNPGSAEAAMGGRPSAGVFWTSQPVIVPVGRPQPGGQATVAAKGVRTDKLIVLSPRLPQGPVEVSALEGRWSIQPPEASVGGYHWLLTRSSEGGEVRTAFTAWSFPSHGPSPQARLNEVRPGLEVLPKLIPERGGFREGDTRDFLVRFDGNPLPGIPLSLETENGSRVEVVSDASGFAQLKFPRDFSPESIDKEAGATRSRKAYVVSATLERDGVRHVSAFNQFYYPDLMRERSLAWGAGFTVFGMLLAVPLLRRKEKNNG